MPPSDPGPAGTAHSAHAARSARSGLKAAVRAEIDRRAEEITALSRDVLENPETGFREERTARPVRDRFSAMGPGPRSGPAGTGVAARTDGRAHRRTAAVLGELGSLPAGGAAGAERVIAGSGPEPGTGEYPDLRRSFDARTVEDPRERLR